MAQKYEQNLSRNKHFQAEKASISHQILSNENKGIVQRKLTGVECGINQYKQILTRSLLAEISPDID